MYQLTVYFCFIHWEPLPQHIHYHGNSPPPPAPINARGLIPASYQCLRGVLPALARSGAGDGGKWVMVGWNGRDV